MKYGGIVKNVPRNKVSERDPRSEEQINNGGMIGGDRMYHHGYADSYARYLRPLLRNRKNAYTILEFGVLKGTGLAIWCDLFPNSRVIGLDIDLDHAMQNRSNLIELGAYKYNEPELFHFDQFFENKTIISDIVGENRIEICIDDGFHSIETIINTFNSVVDFLADSFVYFIEDNTRIASVLKDRFPDFHIFHNKGLTVITRKK